MGIGASLGKLGQYKQMFSKYKSLQKNLQNLVIRAKEGKYMDNGEEVLGAVIVDITGEMKLKKITIQDESLLSPSRKTDLENLIEATFQKAQNKAQEVVGEKSKDILGMDPSDLAGMMGGL